MDIYNDYNSYLRARYGCKVHKIGLDAGFSCPNRDGTKARGGCLYCNEDGSRSSYADPRVNIRGQLAARIGYLKKRGAKKFIAYFQAFTNTHAPLERLEAVYAQALGFDDIVGISIGTRPDCVDDARLGLISSYADRYEVWLELGLQSVHNRTLERIARGHTFEDFLAALNLAGKFNIPVCAHIIVGLPGETREETLKTAETLSRLKVGAVKIHLLHVLRGSPLERLYGEGKLGLLTRPEYVELVCDILERLSPEIIIQRLTGQGDRLNHIAPAWALDKTGTIENIKEVLRKRGTRQGFRA